MNRNFLRGKAGMDSLPKSHYGRFVHPGFPPTEERIVKYAEKIAVAQRTRALRPP